MKSQGTLRSVSPVSRRAAVALLAACITATASASAGQMSLEHAALATSSSRLQWDQAATSASDLARHEFRLYVNGVLMPLSDVRCTGPLAGLYQCSGRIPVLARGTHSFQVSARRDNVEGRWSSPLTVAVDPRQAGTFATASATSDGEPTQRTCFSGDGAPCYRVASVAALQNRVTAATVSPDGRLWLVEDGKHVRIVADGRLLGGPALSVSAAEQQIVGISVDPSFATTRFVFVALLDQREPGLGEVTLARYREVGGRLAQGAVIVGGLEVSTSAYNPQFLQDLEGRLYVALPDGDATTGRRPVYAGSLLRFMPDGAVPWGSGQSSPALATGLTYPTAAAVAPVGRSLVETASRCAPRASRPASQTRPPLASRATAVGDIRPVASAGEFCPESQGTAPSGMNLRSEPA